MLNFLKRLFKPEILEEAITAENLLFWFDNKVKNKLKNLDKNVDLIFNLTEEKKKLLSNLVDELEKAEIKEPEKIENRIKNVVVGHRDNYVRALRIFINDLATPAQRTLSEAIKFNQLLKEKLDFLGKTTAKSYGASQHLFHAEVEAIVRMLKEFDEVTKDFDQMVERNKLKEIETIRLAVDLFYKKVEEKNKLWEESKAMRDKFESLKLNKQKKAQEIEVLEKSEEYQEYLSLKDKKETVEAQIKENQSHFLEIFASLERPFRKYEHMALEDKDLVGSYLDNPLEAFFKDEPLVFLKIVEKMKHNLGAADLKDSKREKAEEVIGQLTAAKLKEMQQKNKELQEERLVLAKKIDNVSVVGKLSDARYKSDHFDAQIADLEQEIKELEEYLPQIDLEKVKEMIKEKMFNVFGVRLTIN